MVAPAAMANTRVPEKDPVLLAPPVSCHWVDSAKPEMNAGMSVDSTITHNTSPPSMLWLTLAVESTVTWAVTVTVTYAVGVTVRPTPVLS